MRRVALAIACAVGASACAASKASSSAAAWSLRGATAGAAMDVLAEAELAPGLDASRFAIGLVNHGLDPIAIELDAVTVRDARGGTHVALGKVQRFRRGDGTTGEERVPWGPVTIGPRARARIALELSTVPLERGLVLVLPRIYRLGIDGQVPLPALQIPLRATPPAGAAMDEVE